LINVNGQKKKLSMYTDIESKDLMEIAFSFQIQAYDLEMKSLILMQDITGQVK